MNPNTPKQVPRHDDGLHVLEIGRVSTPRQNESNIEASYDYVKPVLEHLTDAPIKLHQIGEQGSGMIVERETMLEAYELIEEGWPDVVLMEDLSKAYRNPRWALALVQDCMDAEIRVIAPGDNFDSFDENCEVTLQAGCLRHGLHIPDTRRRVRRTASYAFERGGMVLRARFGYRKLTRDQAKVLEGHPDELLIARIPDDTPTIQQLRTMIVHERMYGQPVADWLTAEHVPTGPYVQQVQWQWQHVLDLLRDPILWGWRRHRQEIYKPQFKDGKHRREKNPEPQWRHWPCLAHMSEAEFDELQQALDALSPKNRPKSGPDHPRHRVRRSDSVSPYQHATCAACESILYRVGHTAMKCNKAWRGNRCWNHVQVDAEQVRTALVDLLLERVQAVPAAQQALLDVAWEQFNETLSRSNNKLRDYDREIQRLKQEASRLSQAIQRGIKLDDVIERCQQVEQELAKQQKARKKAAKASGADNVPQSREELAIEPRAVLLHLARTSFGFADFLRTVFPQLVVQPVQQIDTGQVRPRIRLTLELGALMPEAVEAPDPESMSLDLFEPPKHLRWLPEVLKVKTEDPKLGYVKIGRRLGIGRMTAKRALDYHKLMQEHGLDEPYRVLTEKPAHASRWKSKKTD